MNLQIPFQKLSETAKMPTKAHWDDAGWDLYSDEDAEIKTGETRCINTNIAVAIPEGYCGVIFDRSSLGVKGLGRLAGVIDAQYRGPIKVCLHNHSHGYYKLEMCENTYCIVKLPSGSKIAQMLILPVPAVQFVETDELPESHRGEKGFGSSGKN